MGYVRGDHYSWVQNGPWESWGETKTLSGTGRDLCHLQPMADWLDMNAWRPGAGGKLSSRNIDYIISTTPKDITDGEWHRSDSDIGPIDDGRIRYDVVCSRHWPG